MTETQIHVRNESTGYYIKTYIDISALNISVHLVVDYSTVKCLRTLKEV